jgi:hypothetical protein
LSGLRSTINTYHVTFFQHNENKSVTVRHNLPDIVRFGPYRPHEFVLGDHAWSQNASDKLATNTINKGSYHILTRRCEILQSTPLKEPDDSVGTTGQPVRLAPIPNVIARHNLLDVICFGPYCPYGFILGDHAWSQNTSDKLATSTTNKASYYILTHRCEIL